MASIKVVSMPKGYMLYIKGEEVGIFSSLLEAVRMGLRYPA